MATEKNITMREFNGTDYDTLYPKTIATQIPDVYSKTEILTTETLAKYGLTADKLPDDVFQQIKTSIESRAKIQTGSYVGTGTYGASNPCSLTFDFVPKMVLITATIGGTGGVNELLGDVFIQGQTASQGFGLVTYDHQVAKISIIWNDKTLSWYSSNTNHNKQLNQSNTTYHWVCLG